jgi:hypothetical protein
MTDQTLSSAERHQLDVVGDALIPASGVMPSVSQSDPDGRWLERALQARPELTEPIRMLLAAHPGLDSVDKVADAEAQDPVGVAALVTITAGRYYMIPHVRELLGYPGQGGRDPTLPSYRWERAADMLERVVERGPIYRAAP